MPQLGWFGRGFRFLFGLEMLSIAIYLTLSMWNMNIENLFLNSVLIFIGGVLFFYGGFSFLLQASLRLSGCEAGVFPYLLKGKPMYDCALKAYKLDEIERERGISFSVLITRPFLLHFTTLLFSTLVTFGVLFGLIPIEFPGLIILILVILYIVSKLFSLSNISRPEKISL